MDGILWLLETYPRPYIFYFKYVKHLSANKDVHSQERRSYLPLDNVPFSALTRSLTRSYLD